MRTWFLAFLPLLLTAVPVQAQDLTSHGRVASVRAGHVEVSVVDPYEVPTGTNATIYTTNTVGGIEQTVPVATMLVESVSDGVATGSITEQLAGIEAAEGFKVSFSSVEVATDGPSSSVELGMLALTSDPSHAAVTAQPLRATATGRTVYRDERSLGRTPVVDSLMPGRYRLTLRKADYRPTRRRVVVSPDSVMTDSVRLMRTQGMLTVDATPDSAVVRIDGTKRGHGTVTAEVDQGEHTVRVTAPDHYAQQRTVSVQAEHERSVDVALEPRLGTLKIASTPDSAQVVVAGSSVGRTPITLEKPPGTYDVRVTASQYKPSTHRVTVTAEETAAVRAELKRPVQVDLAQSHGPGVRNPRLQREDEVMVVTYRLRGDAEEYDVTLRLSDERGTSFPTQLSAVRGDVGDDVQAGDQRTIRWLVLNDYPRGLVGDNFRLRIATDPDGGNAFLYVLGSILTGGGATAAVLMLKGGGSGNGGSSSGETGGIPAPPSPPD